MLTDDTVADILRDPVPGAMRLCNIITDSLGRTSSEEEVDTIVIDAYAMLKVLCDLNGWKVTLDDIAPGAQTDWSKIFSSIVELLNILKEHKEVNIYLEAKNRYSIAAGAQRTFELTDGDLTRIQELINKLRHEIDATSVLPEDHKRRLQAKLERLQTELHKRMSDYDRAYGILIDGIVLVQKFGESVKPITALIRELGNLFWRSHSRAEQLPGDAILQIPTDSDE